MIERYIVGKNQKVSLELISLKLVKGLHKYIFKIMNCSIRDLTEHTNSYSRIKNCFFNLPLTQAELPSVVSKRISYINCYFFVNS